MKPIEMPVGQNAFSLQWRIGNMHVADSYLEVTRKIWRSINGIKEIPRPLRRGIIKMCLETHHANRRTYDVAMSTNLAEYKR